MALGDVLVTSLDLLDLISNRGRAIALSSFTLTPERPCPSSSHHTPALTQGTAADKRSPHRSQATYCDRPSAIARRLKGGRLTSPWMTLMSR
ncbi:MAG: hypothetical protein HC781_22615 [Leptolyngbyaceae cyanobacterium CSU_1_4]|nr:hypothetical protein [Leptolyngbyaceae cyanobacterium CSU_1_4]